ncbi:MAG: TlpA family protein disulfide reductase [Verrucomicrobiaceae bacterium]|nr:TlpA family protein disulfide reductase [Verrucomicrobiaceae bacterium]
MKRFAALFFCLCLISSSLVKGADSIDAQVQAATRVKQGETAPDFSCKTTDGRAFNLGAQKGKVVLLYFFAASVPFSFTEMGYIQKEIVEKLEKREDFTVLCIGRGHTHDEMVKISGENKLRLPMTADSDGAIYGRMFTKFVPRTVLIARDGSIAYLANGSKEYDGIVKLQQAIEIQLKKQD